MDRDRCRVYRCPKAALPAPKPEPAAHGHRHAYRHEDHAHPHVKVLPKKVNEREAGDNQRETGAQIRQQRPFVGQPGAFQRQTVGKRGARLEETDIGRLGLIYTRRELVCENQADVEPQ